LGINVNIIAIQTLDVMLPVDVIIAIWQMYGAAMEPLEGFEHRAIVLPEQARGYMEAIVSIDADQMGVKGGMMDLRQRDAVGHHWLAKPLGPYRRQCGRRLKAAAPVVQITRNDRYRS
jgi:hypothetical protein